MQCPLPLHTKDESWIVWCLQDQMTFLQVTINQLYHYSLASFLQLLCKAKKNNGKYITRIMDSCARLSSLVAKVFVWRALIGGSPLGLALKQHALATSFFCIIQMEDSTHRFIQCLPFNKDHLWALWLVPRMSNYIHPSIHVKNTSGAL